MSQINQMTVLLGKEWNRVEDSLPSEGLLIVFLIEKLNLPVAGFYWDGVFYQYSVKGGKHPKCSLDSIENLKVVAWMDAQIRIKADSQTQPGEETHA